MTRVITLLLFLPILILVSCSPDTSPSVSTSDTTTIDIEGTTNMTSDTTKAIETTDVKDTTDAVTTTPATTAPVAKKIRVACVGDSLTAGVGVTDRVVSSYPGQLGNLLGEGYEVRNFGNSGKRMINSHENAYSKTTQYTQSLGYNPDIVIFMLGTNDSNPPSWSAKTQTDFIESANMLLNSYKGLASAPKVYIMLPPTAYTDNSALNNRITISVVPLLQKIAEEHGCEVIDLHTITNGKRSELYYDHLHLNETGYGLVAQTVYSAMVGSK